MVHGAICKARFAVLRLLFRTLSLCTNSINCLKLIEKPLKRSIK